MTSHRGLTSLTRQERQAGLRRLAGFGAVLVGTAISVGLVFVALGAELGAGIGAGFGLIGVALVLGGVVAFTRTSGMRRTGGEVRRATDAERRSAERLALGLLAVGIAFSIVSLAVA